MAFRLLSGDLFGIEGREVEVEVDLIVDRAGLVLPVPTESRTIEAVVGGTVVRTEVPDGSDQLPYLRFVRWHPSLQLAPWLHLATATLAEPDVDWNEAQV